MSTVIYSMGTSLDGFMAALDGSIDFVTPDEELMGFHNQQSRELAVHVTGRRLYETMLPWELDPSMRSDPLGAEFAEIWSAVPKVVFSRTLTHVEGNATLARRPLLDEVVDLRATDGGGLVSVGGAALASDLARHDLIDEYRVFINPVLVGSGTRFFPELATPWALQLVDHRTFGSGVTYLSYRRSR
jgi:dihydrofolate reductase